ncbi:MAG: O-acetyl-ADP-ribose deacetylase [Candidatus Eremiobacteraeota bacterium]|nr:O-acetyl-ADP-ribose deacetylase [Candidatus Eremiobacteraeota bacterium]
MKTTVGGSVIELAMGDITGEEVEAIVNAANSGLRGGGGVDGAIHRAGGPAIMEECRRIGHCPPGEAVITTGGRLKASSVIHTVGPIWQGGAAGEAVTLASCYRESLSLAKEKGITSLAFPSISTGAYGYPVRSAAAVALAAVRDFLREHQQIRLVRFVLFDSTTLEAYQNAMKELAGD